MKCADICNPCRQWDVSRQWSEMVCEEFFHQGDTERKLSLPVTPLCDRQKTTIAKIQSGMNHRISISIGSFSVALQMENGTKDPEIIHPFMVLCPETTEMDEKSIFR